MQGLGARFKSYARLTKVLPLLLLATGVQARTLDCEEATALLQEHNSRHQVMRQMLEGFKGFSRGEIGQTLDLTGLFVVDPTDHEAVQRRVAELKKASSVPAPDLRIRKGCAVTVDELVEAAEYTTELEDVIRQARLDFLTRPPEIRSAVVGLAGFARTLDHIRSALDERVAHNTDLIAELGSTAANREADLAVVGDLQARQEGMQKVLEARDEATRLSREHHNLEQGRDYVEGLYDLVTDVLRLQLGVFSGEAEQEHFHRAWSLLYSTRFSWWPGEMSLDEQAVTLFEPESAGLLVAVPWHLQRALFVYEQLRQQEGVSLRARGMPGSLAALSGDFSGEIRQMIRLPVSALVVAWQQAGGDKEGELMLLLVNHLGQLLAAVFLFAVLAWLASRLPSTLLRQQLRLVRAGKQDRLHTAWLLLLRFLRPNLGWLLFMLLAASMPAPDLKSPVFLAVFTGLCRVYAGFLLVAVALDWMLARMHFAVRVIVSAAQHQAMASVSRRVAGVLVFLWVVRYLPDNVVPHGYLAFIGNVIFWLAGWVMLVRFLSGYREVCIQFLGLYFPVRWPSLPERAVRLPESVFLPLFFLWAQLVCFAYALHGQLLVFEAYRKLNARLLKIRLEQMHQETDQDEVMEVHESYERWFSPRPPAPLDLLVLQNSLVPQMDQYVRAWRAGKNEENDLLLCGDQGAGKSTLLRQWQAGWKDCPVLHIQIPPKTLTAEEFFSLLASATGKAGIAGASDVRSYDAGCEQDVVIIVDGIHNLYLADEGGFAAYKALLECINQRLEHIFWLLVCNRHAASYLGHVFGHQQRFSAVITLPAWSQQDIRQLVMQRHDASRRRLRFDELLLSSAGNADGSAMLAAETRCFNLLWDQSGGNPSVALALWINAASSGRGNFIQIGVPERPSGAILREYADDLLFAYAAIVLHDNLTVDEAVIATNLAPSIAHYAFKVGQDAGFLEPDGQGRCHIHPLWYVQLVTYLNKRNFLHE